MDSFYFDEPPSYVESRSAHTPSPSPKYSITPGRSELVISSRSKNTHISQQDYVYRSKRLIVNLGPKAWGTSLPVYGYHGSVRGTLSLTGDLKNISSITIKLEGAIISSYTERGIETKTNSVALLSTSTSYTMPPSGDLAHDHSFSLTFPVTSDGKKSALPPSSALYLLGRTCKVTYRLKVIVALKGLRRNYILKIPILYLPRTFAKSRAIESILGIFSDASAPSNSYDPDSTKEVHMRLRGMDPSSSSNPFITLLLPSALSFATHDAIPLQLRVSCPGDKSPARSLLQGAKIQLIKRTWTRIHGVSRSGSRLESVVGVGELVGTYETSKSSFSASYELHIDQSALQSSWAVEGIAEQQYYIRATVYLPPDTLGHIPNYHCEQSIELTTDAYDSPEREMEVLGGYSRPYIGALVSGLSECRTSDA